MPYGNHGPDLMNYCPARCPVSAQMGLTPARDSGEGGPHLKKNHPSGKMQPVVSGFFLLFPEGGVISPERIDPGKKQEQCHENNRDERAKAGACRFSHGAVRMKGPIFSGSVRKIRMNNVKIPNHLYYQNIYGVKYHAGGKPFQNRIHS